MATMQYRVRFEVPPSLDHVAKKLRERTGLRVVLGKDAIESGHELADLGPIREAGSLECDDAGDSDLDITVGKLAVRVDCMEGTNLYFRDCVLAVLKDLGGKPDHEPGPLASKKWSELKPPERELAVV